MKKIYPIAIAFVLAALFPVAYDAIWGMRCAFYLALSSSDPKSLLERDCRFSAETSLQTSRLQRGDAPALARLACERNAAGAFELISGYLSRDDAVCADGTLLRACAEAGCAGCCETLLEMGLADPDAVDSGGKTAFDVAATREVAAIVLRATARKKLARARVESSL